MARLQPSQGRQRPGGCPGAHARAACRTCRRTCAPSPRQATAPRRPCSFVFSQLDAARGSRNRRKRHLDQSGHAPRAKPPTHLLPIAVEEVSARDASRVGGKDARDDAGGLLQGGKCGQTRAHELPARRYKTRNAAGSLVCTPAGRRRQATETLTHHCSLLAPGGVWGCEDVLLVFTRSCEKRARVLWVIQHAHKQGVFTHLAPCPTARAAGGGRS